MTRGERIRRARDGAGLSISAVARALGVAEHTVSRWERKNSNLSSNHLDELSVLLEVDPTWLLRGDGAAVHEPR